MGTEVLRPQDCLIQRMRVAPVVFSQQYRRRNFYANGNGSPVGSRKPAVRPEQKNRPERPLGSRRSASLDDLRKNRPHQVTILKRGKSLDFVNIGAGAGDRRGQLPARKAASADDMMMQRQIRIGDLRSARAGASDGKVYAGSAFSMSPEPSSLPLPSFFSKKQAPVFMDDDSATRDLRRLLRLD